MFANEVLIADEWYLFSLNECKFPAVKGVCNTPLHLFDYNHGLNDWVLMLFPAVKGVCDTPLHMFDYNFGVNNWFFVLFPAVEGVCDTPLHLFDYNHGLNDGRLTLCDEKIMVGNNPNTYFIYRSNRSNR